MHVREYRAADLAALHVINEAAYPAVGSVTADELAHIVGQSLIALVATDGAHEAAELAGFCLVLAPGADYHSVNYRWFASRYDDFVYLDRVAIAPAYQRRGLGRAFYGEVERLTAVRHPAASQFTLEVNVRPRNGQSLDFHAALGFVEVGQQETDYGTLVSLMAKPLAVV